MRLMPLELEGVFLVEQERLEDDRGWFARTSCRDEFAAQGLVADWQQSSVSWNRRRGTLRGMHFQAEPHAETKLVRCTHGSIFDVAVDLRPASPTYGRWCSAVLSRVNGCALYIPAGFAHGFQTLEDDCEVLYNITPSYVAGAGGGVLWNDPQLDIRWPIPVECLSPRDAALPRLADLYSPSHRA